MLTAFECNSLVSWCRCSPNGRTIGKWNRVAFCFVLPNRIEYALSYISHVWLLRVCVTCIDSVGEKNINMCRCRYLFKLTTIINTWFNDLGRQSFFSLRFGMRARFLNREEIWINSSRKSGFFRQCFIPRNMPGWTWNKVLHAIAYFCTIFYLHFFLVFIRRW